MQQSLTVILIFFFLCFSCTEPKPETPTSTQPNIVVDQQPTVKTVVQNTNQDSWTLTSLDNHIEIVIRNQKDENGIAKLDYYVNYKETRLIEPSPMGIMRQDQMFSENLQLVSISPLKTVKEEVRFITGKSNHGVDQYNEHILTFKNRNDAQLQIIVRVYNDAVAFRYRFPENSGKPHTVTKELTGFDLPNQGVAYMQPYQPDYESLYQNKIPIGQASPTSSGWAFPALFEINSGIQWAMVTESDVDEHFCATHLASPSKEGLYQIAFPEAEEAMGEGEVTPTSTLPWTMPWRVIMLGSTPYAIANSDIVKILATPSKIKDVSWIKPGHASWSWWSDSDSPKNYSKLKTFVDLAAELSWEYTLVDANWNKMNGGNLATLAKYAKTREVGLFVWYNSGGAHNDIKEEPRDRLNTRSNRRAEFERLQNMGIKGIKVDFWNSDKQFVIKYYSALLQDAADHQLMVNLHGCTAPRGWSRTFPNLMTMEAVKGAEHYKFDAAYAENAPLMHTILPFTRNAIGSMDYTPVTFSSAKYPRKTTAAHELALAVIFESGIVHFADKPDKYIPLPMEPKFLLKYMPTAWEETRFLMGWPGQEVILARRAKGLWYIAGINGENKHKTRRLNIRDLINGMYEVEYTKDGEQPGTLITKYSRIHGITPLEIELPPYGGFVIKMRAAQ